MKSSRIILTGLLMIGTSVGPSLPAASAQSTAICLGEHTVSFSPGITTASGKTSYTTQGGTIWCVGEIHGRQVTGPGTFGQEGVLDGNCLYGSGSGTVFITIPASGGSAKLTIPHKIMFVPGVGTKSADQLSAMFEFFPTEGNCVAAPITEIAVVQQTVLK
jgi:hypothetical protein